MPGNPIIEIKPPPEVRWKLVDIGFLVRNEGISREWDQEFSQVPADSSSSFQERAETA
jgi:hypothetical protein